MSQERKSPTSLVEALKDRAYMLSMARSFFELRGVIELDCPILNFSCNIDDFIDPIEVNYCDTKKGFLHTSPELFMKKILALGMGDCYFMGHVFRDHEKGSMHHVEFTMVEWYRLKQDYQGLINETIDFIKLFFPVGDAREFTYREALKKFTGIDYTTISHNELFEYAQANTTLDIKKDELSITDLLTLVFTEKVEPEFEALNLVVLKDYPKQQSALSKIEVIEGAEIARRFEIYYKGVELANGYDELLGADSLEARLRELNDKRTLRGKEKLPLDRHFIEANGKMPDCRGVAVGFDRLMMLRHRSKEIHKSMALVENSN